MTTSTKNTTVNWADPLSNHSKNMFVLLCFLWLKSFQKLNQRALVVIAEPRLFLKLIGAEIVSTIHDQVRTLAELQHLRHERTQYPRRVLITRLVSQLLERALHVEQEFENFSVALRSFTKPGRIPEQI